MKVGITIAIIVLILITSGVTIGLILYFFGQYSYEEEIIDCGIRFPDLAGEELDRLNSCWEDSVINCKKARLVGVGISSTDRSTVEILGIIEDLCVYSFKHEGGPSSLEQKKEGLICMDWDDSLEGYLKPTDCPNNIFRE